jgi:hypothetical protein
VRPPAGRWPDDNPCADPSRRRLHRDDLDRHLGSCRGRSDVRGTVMAVAAEILNCSLRTVTCNQSRSGPRRPRQLGLRVGRVTPGVAGFWVTPDPLTPVGWSAAVVADGLFLGGGRGNNSPPAPCGTWQAPGEGQRRLGEDLSRRRDCRRRPLIGRDGGQRGDVSGGIETAPHEDDVGACGGSAAEDVPCELVEVLVGHGIPEVWREALSWSYQSRTIYPASAGPGGPLCRRGRIEPTRPPEGPREGGRWLWSFFLGDPLGFLEQLPRVVLKHLPCPTVRL